MLSGWFDEDWVELNLDHVDQIAARSEHTQIIVGPPRARMLSPITKSLFAVNSAVNTTFSSILNIFKDLSQEVSPVGFAQGISVSETKQRVPIYELGMDRPMIASVPSSLAQISISRLVVNSESLPVKAFNTSAPDQLKPGEGFLAEFLQSATYDFNLHREDSYWPFGLGMIFYAEFSTKPIGKLYFENCKVVGCGTSVSSGQGIVIDNLQIIAHRAVQIDTTIKEETAEV